MNRYLASILVALSLAGCTSQDQVPSSDPFLVGRTRLPPPATGAATGRLADPYYPTSGSATAPGWKPSGTTTPPTVNFGPPPEGTAKAPEPAASAPSGTAPAATSHGLPPASTTPTASIPGVSFGGAAGTNARGASLQGARTLVSSPGGLPSAMRANVGGSLDDRIPRPIDAAGTAGTIPERKPIVRTLQPRSSDDGASRVIDIADLPAAE